MIGENVTFFVAFLAGFLSFLSPCILPVFPSFLAYLGGISLEKMSTFSMRRYLILNAMLFSLGFMMVFLMVGASIGFLGKLFLVNQDLFQKLGGLIIVGLGIYVMGFLPPIFKREFRFKFPRWVDSMGWARSFLVGVVFAVGWSPCYGPITGAILTLVATQGSAVSGFWLFGWYALGFMVPFVLAAAFLGPFIHGLASMRSRLRFVRWVAGALIVFLGLLLLTNGFSSIVNWMTTHYTQWVFWEFN